MSYSARVGLTVLVALGIFVGAYIVLQGTGLFKKKYTLAVQFDNAQGITQGTPVRLSGVPIGEVDRVSLAPNRRAEVRLLIDERYRNAVGARDKITIATGGLLPTPYIEIIPARTGPPPAGDVLVGQSAVTTDDLLRSFNELLPEARNLVTSLTSVANSLDRLVGDPVAARSLKNAAANLEAASARGKALAANLEAASVSGRKIAANLDALTNQGRPRVARAVANLETASRHFERTTALLRTTMAENRPQVGEALENLSGAMAALEELLEEVKASFGDEELRGNLKETLVQLRETMANLRQTSANLTEATGHIKELTGDPQVNEDLRRTLHAARQTMEQAGPLLKRLNRIVGDAGEGVASARERFRRVDVRADLLRVTDPDANRLDVDASLPHRRGFYRLGVYDFTESNRLNLQLGQALGSRTTVRYGLHRSRLGLGLDLGAPLRPWLEADLYSLRDPRLDVRASQRLQPSLDLTLGVDDLFGANAPVAGVRWRF